MRTDSLMFYVQPMQIISFYSQISREISEFEDLYVLVFSSFFRVFWQHFDICLGLLLLKLCGAKHSPLIFIARLTESGSGGVGKHEGF